MISWLQTWTALPNLHPLLIHFPIALFMIALCFDFGALIFRRQTWFDRAAATLYFLGVMGGIASYFAGLQAADLLGESTPVIEAAINSHSDWAFKTLLVFGVLLLGRLLLAWIQRNEMELGLLPWRATLLIVALVGQYMLFQTGDRGGALVYRHGVGVAKGTLSSGQSPTNGKANTLQTGFQKLKGGALAWRPLPTDQKAFGTILRYVSGSSDDSAFVAAPKGGQKGLGLKISGRAVLVLPGNFGDLKVRARLQLDTFKGTVGLVHHAYSSKQAFLFSCSTEKKAYLYKLLEKGNQKLDSAQCLLPKDRSFVMTVTGYGGHHKGFLDLRTIVHGHGGLGKPGAAGLYFQGKGIVRILSLEILPSSGKNSHGSHDHGKGGKHDHGSHDHGKGGKHDHGSHDHGKGGKHDHGSHEQGRGKNHGHGKGGSHDHGKGGGHDHGKGGGHDHGKGGSHDHGKGGGHDHGKGGGHDHGKGGGHDH